MPHLAIEAIKVKLDSTGEEVLYEPNTDLSAVGVGILIETAHIVDTDTGIETEIEAGSHTGNVSVPVPTTPTISGSVIEAAAPTKIVVTFSEAMQGTASLKDAFDVEVGASTVAIDSISFAGLKMTITLSSPATAGAAVTWAYDDSHATETLESVAGGEADNQTYTVTNNIV